MHTDPTKKNDEETRTPVWGDETVWDSEDCWYPFAPTTDEEDAR